MDTYLIPSSLFAVVIAFYAWKTKTFSPRRVKARFQSARYFETTSKVSREG